MAQSNVFTGPFNLTSESVVAALGYTPVNKAGDTMLGDLKFTDATYDIGKTGATRPRDLFYSRTGQGGTLALGGATIGSNALAVTGASAFAGLGAFSGTSTTTYAAIEVENLSTASNTTKSISFDIYGRDTINTRKIVGRISVIPSDANWAGGGAGGIVISPETADGVVSETARFPHAGGFVIGTGVLGTGATDGFLYVPTCAGTPTGAPTAFAGTAPIIIDTTNHKLYFRSGGVWRDAGP